MPTNLTTTLYERPYYVARERSSPPEWFRHTSPVLTVAAPVFPGNLNSIERAEVSKWLGVPPVARSYILAQLTTRAAIAKVAEYVTLYANKEYIAWEDADRAALRSQWRQFQADSIIDNKLALPISGDDTGIGGGTKPLDKVPQATDV